MFVSVQPANIARFCVAHRKWVLVIHGLLAVATASLVLVKVLPRNYFSHAPSRGEIHISNALFDNSLEAVVGPDSGPIRAYHRFQKQFGYQELIEFVVAIPGSLDAASLSRAARYARDLQTLDGGLDPFWIGTLPHAPDALKLNRRLSPKAVPAFLARLKADPLARHLIHHGEHSTALAFLVSIPPQGRDDVARERLFNLIQSTWRAGSPPAEWHSAAAGVPGVMAELRRAVVTSLTVNFPLANAITFFILFVALRSVRLVLMAFVTLAQSELLAIGLFLATGHAFNYITATIGAVILIIGVATNIHISTRYAFKRRDADNESAIDEAFIDVGRPCLLATATTALALLSLGIADEAAVRDFGLFATAGLVIVAVSSFTLLPALLATTRVPPKHYPRLWFVEQLSRLPVWAWRRPRRVLATAIALCVAGAAGVNYLHIGSNIENYFPKNSTIRKSADMVTRYFPGFVPFELVISWADGGPADGRQLLAVLGEVKKAIMEGPAAAGRPVTPEDVVSVSDFAKSFCLDPGKKFLCMDGYPTMRVMDALIDASPALGALSYVRRKGKRYSARLTVFRDPPYAAAGVRMADQLKSAAARVVGPHASVMVTGAAPLWSVKDNSIVGELLESFLLAVLVIFAVMAAVYRSLRMFLVSILPNVTPLLVVLGGIGFYCLAANYYLSSTTLMFTTMAAGIVVDSTLFFLLTYQRVLRRGGGGEEAVKYTIETVGPGIILTATCLILGFATLTLGFLIPVRALGILLSVTVLFALLADLLILPALCRLVLDRQAQSQG